MLLWQLAETKKLTVNVYVILSNKNVMVLVLVNPAPSYYVNLAIIQQHKMTLALREVIHFCYCF